MESGNCGSEHEFGTFRTSNEWKVEILDLSMNLEHLPVGPVILESGRSVEFDS